MENIGLFKASQIIAQNGRLRQRSAETLGRIQSTVGMGFHVFPVSAMKEGKDDFLLDGSSRDQRPRPKGYYTKRLARMHFEEAGDIARRDGQHAAELFLAGARATPVEQIVGKLPA